MSTMMNATPLPVELYVAILTAIPTSKADPSERTLVNCAQAHSLLRAATLVPAVWKIPYTTRYTYADAAREAQRAAAHAGDWRARYVARRRADNAALKLVDAIRTERVGRHARTRVLVREYGTDVLDALRVEAGLPLPAWVGGAGETQSVDVLPRKYWARAVLGVLARRDAVDVFARAKNRDASIDLVTALGSLSAFFDVTLQEVQEQLEDVYVACIAKIVDKGVPLDPSGAAYDFWELCGKIREAIHELGFQLTQGTDFAKVMNVYPHHFLKPENRATMHRSLCYVFVAVARRLGIQASPGSEPGLAHVHIQPPDGGPCRLLDLRAQDPPILPSREARGGFPPHWTQAEISEAFSPASTLAMLRRSCNSIQSFMQVQLNLDIRSSQDIMDTATYTIEIFRSLGQFIAIGPAAPMSKPLDCGVVLEDAYGPHGTLNKLVSHYQQAVEEQEEQAWIVKPRHTAPDVKYFVGLPVVSVHDDFWGVIIGWDPTHEQSAQMHQSIPIRGGPPLFDSQCSQPFYHVLATDGYFRYVAQRLIVPIEHPNWSWYEFHLREPLFARYFTNMEQDAETGGVRFKPSKELLDMYPDDEEFGARRGHIDLDSDMYM